MAGPWNNSKASTKFLVIAWITLFSRIQQIEREKTWNETVSKRGVQKGRAPKGGVPKGWGPERVGPRRVGPRRVGPRRVGPRRVGPEPRKIGAQNFALFFPLATRTSGASKGRPALPSKVQGLGHTTTHNNTKQQQTITTTQQHNKTTQQHHHNNNKTRKFRQNTKTLKLAKVGLAKVGQDHDWPKVSKNWPKSVWPKSVWPKSAMTSSGHIRRSEQRFHSTGRHGGVEDVLLQDEG